MTRYLLDTNAAADCVFRRRGVREGVRSARVAGHRIGIGFPVLAELLAGIEYSASRDANLEIVNRKLGLLRQWPFTTAAAREFGRLHANLRRSGRTMQTVDLMVAAIALTLGNCTVVTSNSDLSAVPGLRVENWASSC